MTWRHFRTCILTSFNEENKFLITDKCDAVPAAANGQFSLQTDGITTAAILGCSEGYEVTGTGSVSCDSDGSWSIVGEQTCSKSRETYIFGI